MFPLLRFTVFLVNICFSDDKYRSYRHAADIFLIISLTYSSDFDTFLAISGTDILQSVYKVSILPSSRPSRRPSLHPSRRPSLCPSRTPSFLACSSPAFIYSLKNSLNTSFIIPVPPFFILSNNSWFDDTIIPSNKFIQSFSNGSCSSKASSKKFSPTSAVSAFSPY